MVRDLPLKKRLDNVTLTMPAAIIKQMVQLGETDGARQLYQFFKTVNETPIERGDKEWLELIVDWVNPQGGASIKDIAKWVKLSTKLSRVNSTTESIKLTEQDIDLIWSRMTDENFKVITNSPAFRGFLLDFCQATGRHFETVRDDPEEGEIKI